MAAVADAVAPRAGGAAPPLPELVHAQGVWLTDAGGRRYLDGCSGAVAANIGHGVERVVEAIARQARQAAFAYRSQFETPVARELADRLTALAPGDLEWTAFVNSGSEANEAAIRLAVAHWATLGRPSKHRVVGRRTSYHGMTLGALSASGHPDRRRGLEDLLLDAPKAPSLHGRWDRVEPAVWRAEWERTIELAGPQSVAAVIVEPVVGAAGGAIPTPPGYFRVLREVCDRFDVLLIADEVMTGLGRTGRWFASARDGVLPDVVTVGKGLNAGYAPMSALLARRPLLDVAARRGTEPVFGHTCSGHPVAAAACLAVLEFAVEHDLPALARRRGRVLRDGLERLAQAHPTVADVRGEGMLLGFELVADRRTRRPFRAELQAARRLVALAFEEGLLVYPAGTDEVADAILVTPPLTIAEGEIAVLLDRLDAALTAFELLPEIEEEMES